jgi:hypothetical protein
MTVDIVDLITNAPLKDAASIFGSDAITEFKRLQRHLHPDNFAPDVAAMAKATAASLKLAELYAYLGKPKIAAVVYEGWQVSHALTKGSLSDLYVVGNPAHKAPAVLKVAINKADNALIEVERAALDKLNAAAKDSADVFAQYFPKVHASFKISGKSATVLTYADGYHTFNDIVRLAPNLDFRHAVWMVNRALSILGFTHLHGMLHGSILGDHLLYNCATHGLMLVDWCYSLEIGKIASVIPAGSKASYPVEVIRKKPVSGATDLYMLMKLIKSTWKVIPARMRALVDWASAVSPNARPSDVWLFQKRWAEAAQEVYGKPTFIPLVLPKN